MIRSRERGRQGREPRGRGENVAETAQKGRDVRGD